MLPGRIPLVRIPSVLRVLLMQQLHSVVAESLGQYRCGCDGGIEAVAAHDALERDTERAPESVAVYQQYPAPGRRDVQGGVAVFCLSVNSYFEAFVGCCLLLSCF